MIFPYFYEKIIINKLSFLGFLMTKLNYIIRDLKHAEIKLLFAAIVLAVMTVSMILSLTTGIRHRLEDTTGTLLGGDRVLNSPTPINSDIIDKLNEFKIKKAETLTFYSMLSFKDNLALAEVKGVEPPYPLKGQLRGAAQLFAPDTILTTLPLPGTVWIEQSLFSLLNVQVNDTISIGSAFFKITQVLTFEPDRGGFGLMFAPRAIINMQDVAKTQVIQAGSRQTYSLLLAGSDSELNQFEHWLKPKLSATQSYITASEANPTFKNIFFQGEYYLNLILIVNLLLAGIAIWEAARRFASRQINTIAILRCFGATFKQILSRYLWELMLIGCIAGVIGFALGVGIFFLSRTFFEKLFVSEIEFLWFVPALMALISVFVLIFVFAFPPLLKLKNLSPLKILRKDFSSLLQPAFYLSERFKYNLNRILGKTNVSLKYGLTHIIRYPFENMLQILAFSFLFMCIGVLFLVRTSLIQSWQVQIAPDAPNYFVINIEPTAVKQFQEFINTSKIQSEKVFPVVRGRLLSVNNEEVEMNITVNHENNNNINNSNNNASNTPKRRLNRLLNLTYESQLPPDNTIIEGNWFSNIDNGKPVISIEKGFAEQQKIHLNDVLKFQIAEKRIEATVTSIRSVKWDSFNPNFFIIFPPTFIDSLPKAYMTSFFLPPQKLSLLKTFVHKFPSINLIDISVVLRNLYSIIDSLAMAVEVLWALSIIMTFILLGGIIISSLEERKHNAVLLRALGVGNTLLRRILLSEFLLIGLTSGLIAVLGSNIVYAWLAVYKFNLPFEFNYYVIFLGPILAMLLIGFGGWFGTRSIFKIPPAQILSSFKM